MSKPKVKKFQQVFNNSLIELSAMARLSAINTGGSALSDYGTIGYANNYSLISLNRVILTYLFTGNGIFQRAVQTPILDAIRKGIEINSDEASHEDIDKVLTWFEDQGLWEIILNFYTWARLFGGGAILINLPEEPESKFSLRTIQRGSSVEFYDVDRWMLQAPQGTEQNVEDLFLSWGGQDYYHLYGQKIHKSRVIISTGKKAPAYVRRQLKGWGLSVAESMIRDLNNYLKTDDVLYEILDESKIDVYYIQNLANKLLTTGGTKGVQARIQAANELKNYLNALLLDANDKWEQKQIGFAGLAEIKRENRIGIAASLNMPVTKLFGMSSAGFNSGEDDLENYNSMIESEIRPKIKPAIIQLLKIGFQINFGYVPDFRIKFPSLRLLNEVDEENVKTSKSNRILQWYDRGIITAPKAVEMAKKDGIITVELDEDTIPDKPLPPNGENAVMPAESANKIVSVKRVKQGEAEQGKIKQYVVDAMQKKTGA